MIGVLLDLHEQAGHQVDGAAHIRELEEVQRHAVVILDAVQADPGHGILAANIVRIVGLVLMPE